ILASLSPWLISLSSLLIMPGLLCAEIRLELGQDVWHTVLARQALLQDQQVGTLNLGVKVHNRVAILWGPVPSAPLARRVVELLRQIPDLIAVQNELCIGPPEDFSFVPVADESRLPHGSPATLTHHRKANNPQQPPREEMSAWQPLRTGKKDPRMPDH